jgi:hypothetical protein
LSLDVDAYLASDRTAHKQNGLIRPQASNASAIQLSYGVANLQSRSLSRRICKHIHNPDLGFSHRHAYPYTTELTTQSITLQTPLLWLDKQGMRVAKRRQQATNGTMRQLLHRDGSW